MEEDGWGIMSLPKLLGLAAVVLFGSIGIAAWWKSSKADPHPAETKMAVVVSKSTAPQPVRLKEDVRVVKAAERQPKKEAAAKTPTTVSARSTTPASVKTQVATTVAPGTASQTSGRQLPHVDRISQFFIRDAKQFPIVETIVYKSRVPWLQGRPAWLADYASHYRTSRHFIARSLHGKRDYFKQDITEGDRINVLRSDKNIAFHLVVDVLRCKMWFYYLDLDSKEKTLVKSYDVGIGRLDSSTASGFLTPLGKYTLGERTGIYRTNSKGLYSNQEIPMITVFGTRWIPFEDEVSDCTAPSKGLGIHGCPWTLDPATSEYAEDSSGIGNHTSDGCIRLRTDDIEELFAIIISRPTTIELVRDFFDAKVPGVENAL